MNESVDRNWFSTENRKQECEVARQVLEKMKELERTYSKTRRKVVRKTDYGIKIKYIKNG